MAFTTLTNAQERHNMRNFATYTSNSGRVEVVKIGWSWPAFLFGPFWALVSGLWVAGLLALGAAVAISVLAFELPVFDFLQFVMTVVVSLIFGANGNGWLSDKLVSAGYARIGTVQARTALEAAQTVGSPS
jgi:hypothetical protein